MIGGKFFVTPHAVRQFQSRIHNIEWNDALAVIIKGIDGTRNIKYSENKASYVYHVTGLTELKYKFRAVIKNDAVVTILRKGHKKYGAIKNYSGIK